MSNVYSLNRFARLDSGLQYRRGRTLLSIKGVLSIAIALFWSLVLSLATLTSFPTPALADSASTIGSPATAAPTAIDGSNITADNIAADKVDSFAQAYLQVLQLLSNREPELPAAQTSAEALKVQESIESEAVELIKQSGLSLPEYMELLGLASQDATFRDKVLGRMDESIGTQEK